MVEREGKAYLSSRGGEAPAPGGGGANANANARAIPEQGNENTESERESGANRATDDPTRRQ